LGIARFWAQRVNWSAEKQQYVMLGVTGPNEYENNVNNNWFTNYIARWCLTYTLESMEYVAATHPERYTAICNKTNFQDNEVSVWKDIIAKMYLPVDDKEQVFLQQDGYMDKEQILVQDLPASERPINQKWSWDRILRSCFIKQADVLQGIYYFEDHFDQQTIANNFNFYEPRTVHESSLSPCVHAILAAKLGDQARAYEFYLRTARLDLDDYNNDTEDGLHITSMAGTWMAIVQGFAGMRVWEDTLHFNTFIPEKWTSYSFNVQFRGVAIAVQVSQNEVILQNKSTKDISLVINSEKRKIAAKTILTI